MFASGPECGGGAGNAAVATAGECAGGLAAGLGLTLQAAQWGVPLPVSSRPQFFCLKGMRVFQNFGADSHIRDYSLIQPFYFTKGEI